MQIELCTSDINAVRKLQCNLAGSSDYARVTCILMLATDNLTLKFRLTNSQTISV